MRLSRTLCPFSLIFACLLMLSLFGNMAKADLKSFIDRPDDSYTFKVHAVEPVGLCKAHVLRLTSQTWQGRKWEHWLTVLVPPQVRHNDRAILFITGGSNRNKPPRVDSSEAMIMSMLSAKSGAVLAVLQQVPNQPLFNGKYEDGIIAHTFDQYMKTNDDRWPLLMPMVKSTVRAMDTVQTYGKDKLNQNIKEFVVTGASKRGWTTWLTAATDKRVIGIAPAVIDVLNFAPQMKQQLQTYGTFSEKISDYSRLRIPQRLASDAGDALRKLVDPFEYRDKLTIPKLVLLGTNDPYWTVNASSHYFPQLKGSKHLYYEPNTGHGLGPGIFPTLLAFFDQTLSGKTLPTMNWTRGKNGAITVKWKDAAVIPTLWQATSSNRDFRRSEWTSQPLEGKGEATVQLAQPKEGWLAYYIELRFPHNGRAPFGLSTEMTVLPETFPFPDNGNAE